MSCNVLRAIHRLGIAVAVLAAGLASFARAEPPPLIPRPVLFSGAPYDAPQVAPDGTRIAYVARDSQDVPNVWMRTVGQHDDVQVTHAEHGGIGFFSWAWDGRHLLYFEDHHGDENLHLWSLDLATELQRDLTPFTGARAVNLLTSPARPHEVLVGLNLRDRRLYDMYRVDLETGAVVLDTQNPGDVLAWTTDDALQIRAACALRVEDVATVVRVRDNHDAAWRDVVVSPFETTPLVGQANGSSVVLGFAPGGRSFFMVTWRSTDTMRVVEIDAADGHEIASLAQNPRCDVAGGFAADGTMHLAALQHPMTGALQAVGFNEMQPEWQAIDPAFETDFAVLHKAAGNGWFTIENRDRDDRVWVVSTSRSDGANRYSVYDRGTHHLEFLFEDAPELAHWTLVPKQTVRIRARDGMELPAYLTLPAGVPAKQLPFVLLVHGGPWFRDGAFCDPEVQWLANRGYAVLQVQFRGSTGFGKKHLNAGTGEWGRAMQNDLTDAVRWAIARKIADPRRVGIMGGSYGGYATLAGLAFTPELYTCGVDVVGPSNVATLLASFPPYWAPVKKRWVRRIGDAENDAALNERISPLFHADAIRAPLLVGHGSNDPRVKQAESDRIVQALRDRRQTVTYIVYPDEGHGFGRTENILDFYGRVEEFLSKYLGGRAEPWKAVPGSSAEVH